MRFRTLAMVLALACGFTTTVEARHRTSSHKAKKVKAPKAPKFKPRKATNTHRH